MTPAALALALALVALPYQAPRGPLQPTNDTKCDWGPVVQVDAQKGELKMMTPAGLVTYKVAGDVQVFGKDGKPSGPVSALAPGTRVRIYYVIDAGARVQEIDLE
jgi:hypothetical protein